MLKSIADLDLSPDFLVMDSRVSELYEGRLPVSEHLVRLSGGEECKTPGIVQQLWLEMGRAGLKRDSEVTIIGGGTVCDAAAFASSTWKRGVNLTLVPTTLLCMVDACLGGKTAVNIAGVKNQTGTVYPASNIFVCPEFLHTLPPADMVNGIAEALKTAVIGDRQIVGFLQDRDYQQAITACLSVKGRIVAHDLEETGKRKLLNLGHTIGHCLEALSGFSISHGEAVAMGIPVAAEMGGNLSFAEEFREVAGTLGVETSIPSSISLAQIIECLETDKKTTSAGRTWIIPNGWENCEQILLTRETERKLLEKVWQ
jgi:3-dehydroquinate synthetase